MHFHLCLISINHHDRIFDSITSQLKNAFRELGHTCSVGKNHLVDGATNIVLGSVCFAAQYKKLDFLRNKTFVLYQLEQLHNEIGYLLTLPEYSEVLTGASMILDYSESNIRILRELGFGSKLAYLPPSFERCLETFSPHETQDIDVLFVGAYTDRRTHVLEELRNNNVQVVHGFDVYGEQLIDLLRRARIHLNIHAMNGLITLETIRLSYLLANKCFVVSESSDHNPYGDGVVFADYDRLAATCIEYLGPKAELRALVAQNGYDNYRRTSFTEDLRALIGAMSAAAGP